MITSSDPDNDIRIQKEWLALSYSDCFVELIYPGKLKFPKPIRFIFWQLRQYRKIKTGCDVIHCHDLNTLLLGTLLKRKFNVKKLIYDSHEYYLWMMARFPDFVLYPYFRVLQYVAQWYVDTLIVISDTMREYFEARYKFKQIVVVRNTQ
jgi:hypothetical protein